MLQRQSRFGPLLDEVDANSLAPRLQILDKEHVNESTKRIERKIQEINDQLTRSEESTILSDASLADPSGYYCEKQILNINEVSVVKDVFCYDTVEEVCSMVKTGRNKMKFAQKLLVLKIENFCPILQNVFQRTNNLADNFV